MSEIIERIKRWDRRTAYRQTLWKVRRRSLFYRKPPAVARRRAIYLDIKENRFGRYLYCLLHICTRYGYSVHINKKNKRFIALLMMDKYGRDILNMPNVYVVGSPPPPNALFFNDRNLKTTYFDVKEPETSYLIPMCQHPIMYYYELDRFAPPIGIRSNSICFVGDFDPKKYRKITDRGFFQTPNRVELLEHLKKHHHVVMPDDRLDIAPLFEHRIYIVDSRVINLTEIQFRMQLLKFVFFFAFPGMHMPLCHNVIESLVMGCVPIISQEYANLMSPPLEHLETALIYKDLDDLNSLIEFAWTMPYLQKKYMLKAVRVYCKNYLLDYSIVQELENPKYKKFYLLSEQHSIPKTGKLKIS